MCGFGALTLALLIWVSIGPSMDKPSAIEDRTASSGVEDAARPSGASFEANRGNALESTRDPGTTNLVRFVILDAATNRPIRGGRILDATAKAPTRALREAQYRVLGEADESGAIAVRLDEIDHTGNNLASRLVAVAAGYQSASVMRVPGAVVVTTALHRLDEVVVVCLDMASNPVCGALVVASGAPIGPGDLAPAVPGTSRQLATYTEVSDMQGIAKLRVSDLTTCLTAKHDGMVLVPGQAIGQGVQLGRGVKRGSLIPGPHTLRFASVVGCVVEVRGGSVVASSFDSERQHSVPGSRQCLQAWTGALNVRFSDERGFLTFVSHEAEWPDGVDSTIRLTAHFSDGRKWVGEIPLSRWSSVGSVASHLVSLPEPDVVLSGTVTVRVLSSGGKVVPCRDEFQLVSNQHADLWINIRPNEPMIIPAGTYRIGARSGQWRNLASSQADLIVTPGSAQERVIHTARGAGRLACNAVSEDEAVVAPALFTITREGAGMVFMGQCQERGLDLLLSDGVYEVEVVAAGHKAARAAVKIEDGAEHFISVPMRAIE